MFESNFSYYSRDYRSIQSTPILKCVDFLIMLIVKSNLNVEICYIIVRNTILFLTSIIYLLFYPFKRLLSFL